MGVFTGGPAPFQLMMDQLLGFNHLALLLYDEPELVEAVATRIGGIMVEIADRVCSLESIDGFLFSGDMGYKTGTMVAPDALRRYILPWHRRVCDAAHRHGKLVVLHSCGNLAAIMDDLVDCGYDGKHSFQDSIQPGIIELHRRYGEEICLLGGIDVDLLCRGNEEEIRRRVRHFIDEMGDHGYMLGSGNSIPDYVPIESYRAMLDEGLRYGRTG
jgi:uroporphyrinogen decarboxylase